VAKLLTEAWGIPILWTPMSGGLAIRGDLMVGGNPPTHVLTVNIECKHRQDVTLRRVLLDVTRIPVEPQQVVFFKDDGIIWMAWDVVKGPSIAPPQLGMAEPPVFMRIKQPGVPLVGIVKVNYDPGMEFLRLIKREMVHKVPDRTDAGRPTKNKKGGQWEDVPHPETNL